MRLAVAMVGFRNPDDILRCLSALEQSAYADFEVAICENGGAEACAALRSAAPDHLRRGQPVRVISPSGNLGFAGGVNLCLQATRGADAWWLLNPDTEPSAGALAALVERLSRGDCEAVGGTLITRDGRVQAYGGRWRPWLARAESIGIGRRLDDPVDAARVEREQTYLLGASMLVGRRFLETVGPMREDYFLYAEEVEWCLRGRALGMRLGFAPEAIVSHHQGTTTGSAAAPGARPALPVYLDQRNRILLTRDLFPRCLPVAACGALLLLLGRYGRRGAWRQAGYALKGWWAGLRNERGAPPWMEGGSNR